jgi:hypothetical protein
MAADSQPVSRQRGSRIEAKDVAVGDYVWPEAWHGGGTVTVSSPTRDGSWHLVFEAPVVNPPGIWYGPHDALVSVRGKGC